MLYYDVLSCVRCPTLRYCCFSAAERLPFWVVFPQFSLLMQKICRNGGKPFGGKKEDKEGWVCFRLFFQEKSDSFECSFPA